MSKRIKLSNNLYLDSSSISTEKGILLNKYINMTNRGSSSDTGNSNPYRKILSIKITNPWNRTFVKFTAVDIELGKFIFEGGIIVGVNGSTVKNHEVFGGNFLVKNYNDIKFILYNISSNEWHLYCYSPYNWCNILVGIDKCEKSIYVNNLYGYSSSEPNYISKIEVT